MNAEIKSLHLLDEWRLLNENDDFFSNIEIEIGPKGISTSDLFNINVCNCNWIINNTQNHGIFFPKKILIINTLDETSLTSFLSTEIASINGKNWEELARKLALVFNWEYDNYIE